MSDQDIQLKLTGRLSYEDKISIAQATQIIAFIDAARASGGQPGAPGLLPVLGQVDPPPAGSSPRPKTVATPRDALDVSGAKTNPEKVVALAAYVLQDGEFETFTLDTIRPLFHRARETTPRNLTRDLGVAIQAGWISEGEAKDELYLTSKVENVLQAGFDSVRTKRSGVSGPKARNSNKKRVIGKPDVFAAIDTFPATMDGLPSYHHIKLKRDKMLWAIKLAKSLGVPGLQNKDLVWLTDKLGEGIASNDINGNFRGLHRHGYANRSTIDNVVRITESGETYLKSLASAND
jgi:hypothetical protein